MKYFLVLLLVILMALGLALSRNDAPPNNEPVTGLPWQIDLLPGGETRVFGITLGRTSFGEAMQQLGEDLDLAIIAAPQETGTLEAYYSHYSAGPITGKLILIMDVAPDTLTAMRERSFQDGGTRRHHLHPDDLPAAYQAPVRIINFMPSLNLDEEIAHARFGIPAEIIQVNADLQHLLYPEKRLDLLLSADGKEVLQYLTAGGFNALRAQLRESQ